MASPPQSFYLNEMVRLAGVGKGTVKRELALYEEDVLGFIKDTQDEQWQKFCTALP